MYRSDRPKWKFGIMLGLVAIASSLLMNCSSNKREGDPAILVFTKTAGYHHQSIGAGVQAIMKLGEANHIVVDTTSDASNFTDETLQKYSALVFLNSTGSLLDYKQEDAMERYIQAGGGYVGVHAAADAEYDWKWYGHLVGGYFLSHPKIQEAKYTVLDSKGKIAGFEPNDSWMRTDEMYNYKERDSTVNVLITLDEKTYEGGKNGDYHPIAWYHEYDGGRAFYTGLGHTEESYQDPTFLKQLLGGIEYAIGKNEILDYSKATTQNPPEANRFTKTTLAQDGNFYEPTEMTILPNMDILIAQRRGELMLYKNGSDKIEQVGKLNVYSHTLHTPSVNAEEGFLGLQRDPNYATNHWIYAFYSPADTSVNRLSRFTFKNDQLDMDSEKVILQFHADREICCHTGGSVAFGPEGLLYLSTGDNSTPFDEKGEKYVNHGFAPLNDTPGHQQYDARRSSGNSNDLRGKILRIKLNDDGTYDIPEGNLFAPGTPKTRPEIYTMGHRNPYRISVDQENGTLYWGEVGPDASKDSLDSRGPRGYDEVNQAKKAGFYGWPLIIGDNYPYYEYDYVNGKPGKKLDPNAPVNDSRNNTGIEKLPKAHPAFIWYPYADSPDFPQVGTGGRNAMAGPVYHADLYPKETRMPDYYDGKFIIYDWIRGWIKAVTMFPNGDYDKMEPFAPDVKVNSLIDMEMGPDGRLYFLEYGSGWFTKNPDAGLFRLDFEKGNRAPVVSNFHLENAYGIPPFKVKAEVEAMDPDNDSLTYTWHIGADKTIESHEPSVEFLVEKEGEFPVKVDIADGNGGTTTSMIRKVGSGNQQPEVTIELQNNQGSYDAGKGIAYEVKVTDDQPVQWDKLMVSVDYTDTMDEVTKTQGHQQISELEEGKNLMESLDCKTCHKVNEVSIGPSFMEVSKKYGTGSQDHLINKIIKGGNGVWGEVNMPAHPDLPKADVTRIVKWIASLSSAPNNTSLPRKGTIYPKPPKGKDILVIKAQYTDPGTATAPAASQSVNKALAPSK